MRLFEKILKRYLPTILISAAVIFVNTGCGNKSQHTNENIEKSPIQQAAKDKKISSSKKDTTKKTDSTKDDSPKLQLSQQGVTLSWMENGKVRMKATGKESKYNDISKVASMLNFGAQLYDNGKLTASLSAPKALADTTTRIVTATGGVTLKSLERNTTVKASWIKWYAKKQKVVGDGGVKITTSMGTLQGAAFVADTSMKTITIKDSAKGLNF